jgi:hypothetical protein
MTFIALHRAASCTMRVAAPPADVDLAGAPGPAQLRDGHLRGELLERRPRGQALPLGASLRLDHGEDPASLLG